MTDPNVKQNSSIDEAAIKQSKNLIEEDDEFEDFACVDTKQLDQEVLEHGWEDAWVDDEKEEDFFDQLCKESVKKDGVAAMKM